MSMQQLFEDAIVPVIEQGGGSYDFDHLSCLYRGPNGRKCAIGHLIPDELYNKRMENKSICNLLHTNLDGIEEIILPLWRKKYDLEIDHNEFADTLDHIQRLHDKVCHEYYSHTDKCNDEQWIEAFKERVIQFCKDEGLDFSFLNEKEDVLSTVVSKL